MDHHTLAAVSAAGTCLDVLGSLYLAYDLLGGQHGPLRLLTRAVTYSIVFGVGYGLGLGPFFGLAAGIATGITLAMEFGRQLAGWIITLYLGKRCFPRSEASASERDCICSWDCDSQWHSRFSSQPAKSSRTHEACVLRSIMKRGGVRGLRAASFAELSSVQLDTCWRRSSAARSSVT